MQFGELGRSLEAFLDTLRSHRRPTLSMEFSPSSLTVFVGEPTRMQKLLSWQMPYRRREIGPILNVRLRVRTFDARA
jgi:hypothetical protein